MRENRWMCYVCQTPQIFLENNLGSRTWLCCIWNRAVSDRYIMRDQCTWSADIMVGTQNTLCKKNNTENVIWQISVIALHAIYHLHPDNRLCISTALCKIYPVELCFKLMLIEKCKISQFFLKASFLLLDIWLPYEVV